MKIGYVFDDSLDRPDGVQQAVLTTGEWMRAQGHEVHYLVASTKRQDIANVHPLAKSLTVKFNGNRMSTPLPTSSAKLHRFLELQHYDVLHVQMPFSPFFAARVVLAAPSETKIVGTFHILPYSTLSRRATHVLGSVLRQSLKKFNHLIAVSKPAAEFAAKSFGGKYEVVPNPVVLDGFLKARKNHKPGNKKRVVFLGRLVERKGILELLSAYKVLLDKYPEHIENAELIIAGKGELDAAARKLAAKFPPKFNCEFVGYIDEIAKPKLLAEADLAVFPSTSGESFGIVLVEAMAAGSRLILAGDNPGYHSVLVDQPKLLVNPKHPLKFAEKLHELLAENSSNEKLSQWLRDQAPRYSIDTVGKRLLEIYES